VFEGHCARPGARASAIFNIVHIADTVIITASVDLGGIVLVAAIVATVGAIGIVAAVPVTTALAAGLLASEPGYPGRSVRTARDSLGASSAYPTVTSTGESDHRADRPN